MSGDSITVDKKQLRECVVTYGIDRYDRGFALGCIFGICIGVTLTTLLIQIIR